MGNHLFISYAHSEKDWVVQFHERLEGYLFTNLGVKPRIWRDDELRDDEIFAEKISKQIPETEVLVSVLSEPYLKSEWCARELREFCRAYDGRFPGLVVDDTARILQVMLKPIKPERKEELAPILKEATGYQFYRKDEATNRWLPLKPEFGKEYEEAYNRQIFFLAEDLADLINKIEEEINALSVSVNGASGAVKVLSPGIHTSIRPAVYLAECSYDRREDREKIRGALREKYRILPDQDLPRSEEAYKAEVSRLLDRCKLSIHLVGAEYGWAPEGPSRESGVVLQNDIAAEKSKTIGLQRVIWVPEGTHGENERQKQFITDLHEKAEAQYGADLLTDSYQKLLNAIDATLEKTEQAEAESRQTERHGARMVYVICDERDRKATVPLRRYLKEKGFEVRRPIFNADYDEARKAHEKDLANCDVIIVFYGAGDEAWKRGKEDDLKGMVAYRVKRRTPPIFTYLAAPATDDKEDLIELEEPNLIDCLDDFSETAVETFIAAMGPHRVDYHETQR